MASRRTLSVLLLWGAAASLAPALSLVDSQGFEPAAGYDPGNLVGQEGWRVTPGAAAMATVQGTVVRSGQQAVRVQRGGGEDRFWAVQPFPSASGRFVSIDWDMRVESTAATSGFGPFFGVAAFDQPGGEIAAVASLGVDATTGDVVYQAAGTGFILETPFEATPGAWRRYRLELDFATDTYRAFVDGQLAATTGFIDAALGIDGITDVDIATFAAGGDSASAAMNGVAFFDNFVVRDGVRGDFNDDGLVDAADYTVWRAQNGQVGFGLAADADASGDVGPSDYGIWAQLYGQSNALTSSSLTSSASSAPVPEPASACLAALAAVGATRRRFA